MEPQKRYTQVVKKAFHISMAALDQTTCTDETVQVMCGYDNRKYLLCTLQKDQILQCALDLNFDVGTEVSFITNGGSHVHLSGYLVEDESMFDNEDEEEDEADVSLGNISASNIIAAGKRPKSGKAEGQLNGLSAKINKKLAALSKNATPAKKLKTMDLLQEIDDEDDEDDSDVDLDALLADSDEEEDDGTTEDVDEDDDEDGEEEEDDEEGEEEEDDDEDDDDDIEEEEESDDEEEEVFDTPPQNGTAKKSKKALVAEKKNATQQEQKSSKADRKSVSNQQTKSPIKKTAEGGVQIEELRVGSGALAKTGKMVQVYYEGRFKSNSKMFDSSTKGNGFKFRLGRGEVIKGWDVGVAGMKVGGKRRIICPPAMAYGARGSPPTIPPNSTLMFEVELKNVS